MLASAASTGILLGVSAHLISQVIEPPLVATVRLHALAFIGVIVYLYKQQDITLILSAVGAIIVTTTYVLTLTASIAIYRLYFHRLRSVPGDTFNSLTNFSWMPIDWHGKRTFRLESLHSKYGPVVRIGPREVSIASIDALKVILSADKKGCSEGPRSHAQIFVQTPTSLQDRISLRKGSERRRQAMKNMSDDLQVHLQSLQGVVDSFITQIRKQKEIHPEHFDIAELFHRFSIEAATLLGVGKSIKVLKDETMQEMIEPIDEQIRMLNTVATVPYCIEAVHLIPSTTRHFDRWIQEACSSKEMRDKTSFVSLLVNKEEQTPNNAVLTAESRSFTLHTSAAVRSILTFCLMELLSNRDIMDRLQQEIRQSSSNTVALYGLPFLDACLAETLRLWPPIPCSNQLITPSAGLESSKSIMLPGNVILSMPSFLLQRDPSSFSSSNEFIPSRWLKGESSAFMHNIDALCPFGSGASECLSTSLVLMQCRMLLSELLRQFEVQPAAQLSAAAIRGQYRDQYFVAKATCNVVIRE